MVAPGNEEVARWARQLRKGVLDLLVLSRLARAPAHGYALIHALKQEGAMAAEGAEATVYQALQRLARVGWAEAAWSTPAEGERPRKMYSITAAGQQARDAMATEWNGLAKAVARHLEDP